MRRACLGRTLAGVFSVWFALVLVEPAMLHACPVHDGAARPTQGATHVHDGHAAASPSHPDPDAHCLCLGECAGTAGVGLPAAVTTIVVTTLVAARDTGLPDYAYVPVAVAHVIPFANGPPTA